MVMKRRTQTTRQNSIVSLRPQGEIVILLSWNRFAVRSDNILPAKEPREMFKPDKVKGVYNGTACLPTVRRGILPVHRLFLLRPAVRSALLPRVRSGPSGHEAILQLHGWLGIRLDQDSKLPGSAAKQFFPIRDKFPVGGRHLSKYRLVDAETGMTLRHYVRTLQEADREREWYEQETGKEIRIVKIFDAGLFHEASGREKSD